MEHAGTADPTYPLEPDLPSLYPLPPSLHPIPPLPALLLSLRWTYLVWQASLQTPVLTGRFWPSLQCAEVLSQVFCGTFVMAHAGSICVLLAQQNNRIGLLGSNPVLYILTLRSCLQAK